MLTQSKWYFSVILRGVVCYVIALHFNHIQNRCVMQHGTIIIQEAQTVIQHA